MIVVGMDASTSCTGYSVFADKRLIDYGAIMPKSDDWRERVMQESLSIRDILFAYKPDILCAEAMPLKPGNKTLEKLGAIHGVLLCLCAELKIKPIFLLPSVWRKKIGIFDGTREGMKREVLKEKAVLMANEIFNLDLIWAGANSKKSQDDVAEAILIAYSQIK